MQDGPQATTYRRELEVKLKPGTADLAELVTRMRGGTSDDVDDTVVQALTQMLERLDRGEIAEVVDDSSISDVAADVARHERIRQIVAASPTPPNRAEIQAALAEQGDVITDPQVITNALTKLTRCGVLHRADHRYRAA